MNASIVCIPDTDALAAWVLAAAEQQNSSTTAHRNSAHAILLRRKMEHKKAVEAFRVRQFAGPHPALSAGASASAQPAGADPLGVQLVPDHERVIIHFDVDCFYAQGAPSSSVAQQTHMRAPKGTPLTCCASACSGGVPKPVAARHAPGRDPEVPGGDSQLCCQGSWSHKVRRSRRAGSSLQQPSKRHGIRDHPSCLHAG